MYILTNGIKDFRGEIPFLGGKERGLSSRTKEILGFLARIPTHGDGSENDKEGLRW